jgi:hypothetical protein
MLRDATKAVSLALLKAYFHARGFGIVANRRDGGGANWDHFHSLQFKRSGHLSAINFLGRGTQAARMAATARPAWSLGIPHNIRAVTNL